MEYTRAVIKKPIENSFVEDLAWTDGWDLEDLTPRRAGEIFQKTWTTNGGKTRIDYVEDPMADLLYVLVAGEDQEKFIRKIRKAGPVYTSTEIHQRIKAAKTPDERAQAIMIAGVAAPAECDAKLFAYFKKAFTDENAQVRRAVVIASVYAGWPELREPLQQLKQDDPDAEIREVAEHTLDGLSKHTWAVQS